MKRIFGFLVLVFILSISDTAEAGVFLCNETSLTVNVAIGFKDNGHWRSKGWYVFQPKECNSLMIGIPQNRYFYFYAESSSGETAWNGKGEETAGFFCTSDKQFDLNSDSNNCEGKVFKRKDLNGADQYSFSITEKGNPTAAAINCQSKIEAGRDAFAKCWMRGMATEKQQEILNCWDKTDTTASFAICANKDRLTTQQYQLADCAAQLSKDHVTANFATCVAGTKINETDKKLINCAIENKSSYSATLQCAALSSLSPEQQKLYGCMSQNAESYVGAATCIAGNNLPPEQGRIVNCVLNNRGSYAQMGVCAAGSKLSPEQQAFVSCAMSTGGQPYAFAGCVGTQLTANELQKCMTVGVGGDDGCFGKNNTAVKFVSNAFKDVTEGPGPSNDLLGRDGWVGRNFRNAANDLQNGPGPNNDIVGTNGWAANAARNVGNDVTNGPGENNDLVGKNGFVCQTLFGGC